MVDALPRAGVKELNVPNAVPRPAAPAVLIKFRLDIVPFLPDMLKYPLHITLIERETLN
jgi:hypothetical protein